MNNFLQSIADILGAGEFFRSHSHHVPRMGRVLLVGGVGFTIQTVLFEVLGIWLGIVAPSTATPIGAECAIVTNFLLNERFSFHDQVDRTVRFSKRLLKFHLVCSGSLLTQWTCVFIAEGFTQSALLLSGAYIIGVGIGFIFNYLGYYFFVWRKK